jgi:hypothetical protein
MKSVIINELLVDVVGNDMNGSLLYEYNGVLLTGTSQYSYCDITANETTNFSRNASYSNLCEWALIRSRHVNGKHAFVRKNDGWLAAGMA